jgi:hypothetical protein
VNGSAQRSVPRVVFDLSQPLLDSSNGNEQPTDRDTVVISSDDDSDDDSGDDSGDGGSRVPVDAKASDGALDRKDTEGGQERPVEGGINRSYPHRHAEESNQAPRPVHLVSAPQLFLRSAHACVGVPLCLLRWALHCTACR